MIWGADSQRAMGLLKDHLCTDKTFGVELDPEAGAALQRLADRAEAAGLSLAVASGYRDYARQLTIFNGKVRGQRNVHDDDGAVVPPPESPDLAWLHAILRFSALPGTSRHHWGTDFDVWSPDAVEADYVLQLTPAEYANGGVFGELSDWLGDLIARDDAEGFYRPYNSDRGGVAPEPWHLSYRPRADYWRAQLQLERLETLWRTEDDSVIPGVTESLAVADLVIAHGDMLLERYVDRIAE